MAATPSAFPTRPVQPGRQELVRPLHRTVRREPLSAFAATASFLFPVAWLPGLASPSWAPKAAIALLVAAVGFPRLVQLAVGPRPGAARAALALLVVATASALTSGDLTTAVFGLYQWGTGLLFVAAVVGAWAIGVSLPTSGRRLVERALLAGCLVTAAFGVLQLVVPDILYGLPTIDDRATGLTGNPVYFGGLVAAAIALVAPRSKGARWPGASAIALLAAAVQLSGSRVALVLAVVIVGVTVIRHRRLAWPSVAALVVGLVVGSAVGHVGASTSGSDRLVEGAAGADSGLTARLETWRTAPSALADTPLLGAGPGRFRAASSQYRTLALARAEGPDRLFADAHNLAVEAVVTLGLPGAVVYGFWLALAARHARGPLAAFALALGVLGLMEPQSIATVPVALLALGAAGSIAPAGRPRLPAGGRTATGGLVIAAALLGLLLLVGDRHLEVAARELDLATARRASRLLPAWPEPVALVGRVEASSPAPDALDHARASYLVAARRDPALSGSWNRLGVLELKMGLVDDGRRHLEEALEHDPWSRHAMLGLARAAMAVGDETEAERWLRRVLEIGPDPWAEEQLRKT